jgi:hypothetical protein
MDLLATGLSYLSSGFLCLAYGHHGHMMLILHSFLEIINAWKLLFQVVFWSPNGKILVAAAFKNFIVMPFMTL